MEDENLPAHVIRIQRRLEALGLSGNAASQRAFGNPSGIKNIINGRSRHPGIDAFQKLAPVLETSASWLAFGDGDDAPSPVASNSNAYLPVTGESSAGQWLDVEDIDHPRFEAQPIAPDPRWPAEAQFVLLVRGTSIDNIAGDGDYISCVDATVKKGDPKDGDLVVIQRTRDFGQIFQRTAKVYRSVEGRHEFHPNSTDPAHKPIVIDPAVEAPEGTEVRVMAYVTWAHRRITGPSVGPV